MSDRFKDPRHIKWAKTVKKAHEFSCIICGTTGGILHAHHMNSYDWCEEQRFDTDNGTCLCAKHHEDFHARYGYGQNTYQQFIEFKKICELLQNNIKRSI